MSKMNFKSLVKFILKITPCLLLMYFCSNQSYYLIKNITQVSTFIYAIYILLSGNNVLASIFLILSNIVFSFFTNVGIQNEITYLQIFQMTIIYIFCMFLNIKNLNYKKTINIKNNIINKDYPTGLYNKRFLDKLMSTKFDPSIVNSNMIAIDIDDFDLLTLNYGYENSESVLKKVAKIINRKVKDNGYCFRVFGEKFIIIIENNDNININKFGYEIKDLIDSTNMYIDNKNVNICTNIAITSSSNFLNHRDYLNHTMRKLENAKFNFQERVSTSKNNKWMM